MAVRIVKHAFEIIHLLTDKNPIQVISYYIMSCCVILCYVILYHMLCRVFAPSVRCTFSSISAREEDEFLYRVGWTSQSISLVLVSMSYTRGMQIGIVAKGIVNFKTCPMGILTVSFPCGVPPSNITSLVQPLLLEHLVRSPDVPHQASTIACRCDLAVC